MASDSHSERWVDQHQWQGKGQPRLAYGGSQIAG